MTDSLYVDPRSAISLPPWKLQVYGYLQRYMRKSHEQPQHALPPCDWCGVVHDVCCVCDACRAELTIAQCSASAPHGTAGTGLYAVQLCLCCPMSHATAS